MLWKMSLGNNGKRGKRQILAVEFKMNPSPAVWNKEIGKAGIAVSYYFPEKSP